VSTQYVALREGNVFEVQALFESRRNRHSPNWKGTSALSMNVNHSNKDYFFLTTVIVTSPGYCLE
jgi:hypothetical protein